MQDGTFRRILVAAGVAAVLAAAGCRDEPPLLQFQKDAARDRDWSLTRDGITVRDLDSRRTVAQIALPGWHWAGAPHGCTPALALGPGGEALVTSDVLPVLWRVDPRTLAVTVHELRLDAEAGMDVGFSGLAYAAQHEGFVAVACGRGSLWRIDSRLSGARKMKAGYD